MQTKNLKDLPQVTTIFDQKKVTRAVKWAISDSGATGHFLIAGAPAVNIRPAAKPITITLPNGKSIKSTHTCNLDIPWLPDHMTEAHTVLGLAHASLISTRKFCNAGCKVMFDKEECRVYFKNKLVLVGGRDITTGLWQLPINPSAQTQSTPYIVNHLDLQVLAIQLHHAVNSLYTMPYKQNQLKYMHQALFSLPTQQIIDAAMNGQLEDIPFLSKPDLIQKYPPPSPATSKG